MAKMGRPKAEKPRSENLCIRVLPEQRAAVDAYAEKYDLTKTQVLMDAFKLLQEKAEKSE